MDQEQFVDYPVSSMITLAPRSPDAAHLRALAQETVANQLQRGPVPRLLTSTARWHQRGKTLFTTSHKWFFVLTGSCTFVCSDGRHPLGRGESLLVPRGVPHDEVTDPDVSDYRSLLIIPRGGQMRILDVRQQRNTINATAITRLPHPQADRIERRLDAVAEAATLDHPWVRQEVEGLLHAALARLAEILRSELRAPDLVPAPVRYVQDAILNRGADPVLSIGLLAKELELDPDWLTVLVRRATGCTPRDLLVNRRLAIARELLSDPRPTIASVAAQSGFRSAGHFTQMFRARCGSTPSDWRRGVLDA